MRCSGCSGCLSFLTFNLKGPASAKRVRVRYWTSSWTWLNMVEPVWTLCCHFNIILTSSQDTILMTCLHLAGLALGLASTFVVPTPSTKPVGTVGALRGCENCWGGSAIHGCHGCLEHPIRSYNQNGSKWIKMVCVWLCSYAGLSFICVWFDCIFCGFSIWVWVSRDKINGTLK